MNVTPNAEYICDLIIDIGPFGKREAQAFVSVGTENNFQGHGQLVGEPFHFAGRTIEAGKKYSIRDGKIRDNSLTFHIGKKLRVNFSVTINDAGKVKGTAETVGVLRARVTGEFRPA